MLWMKRHHGKSWHTLYKETLLELQEANVHLRTLQQQYEGAREHIVDRSVHHEARLQKERTEHTEAILLMRLRHEEQLKEIKIELDALQIELQRIKVKDAIAYTADALIAQCFRILGAYLRGQEPGDKEGAVIGTALGALKTNYQREEALRKQAVKNGFRRVGYPGNATDMNRAMYGLAPAEQAHISEAGRWPLGIGKVPKVNIHIREDEPQQNQGPSQRPPNSTTPDSKGT